MKIMNHSVSHGNIGTTWGRGIWCVWFRNYINFRTSLFTSVIWIALEPMLYLLAIGYGLGRFVSEINGVPYVVFFAPALILMTCIFVSFRESTYGIFSKLNDKDSFFKTILLAPIGISEIVLGEILWSTTKGFFASLGVSGLCFILNILSGIELLHVLGISLVMSWIFSSIGILIAVHSKNENSFIFFQSGFIIPMSLFCGTYFPLNVWPEWGIKLSYTMPLTHGLAMARIFIEGHTNPMIWVHATILSLLVLAFTHLAIKHMGKTILK